MFRPIDVMPINPKNGDKYKDAEGNWHIFKFGRWIDYVQQEKVKLD